MKNFPEEFELMSLFRSEPIKKEIDAPFYYTESIFTFENHTESFVVKLLPAYGEFELTAMNKSRKEPAASLLFKTVSKLEILKDERELAKILLILQEDRDRFVGTAEITFRPHFSLLLKEHFS